MSAPINTPFLTSNFSINRGSSHALHPISSKKAIRDTIITPVTALKNILTMSAPEVKAPQPKFAGVSCTPSALETSQDCHGKLPLFKYANNGKPTACIVNGIKNSASGSHLTGNLFQQVSACTGALKALIIIITAIRTGTEAKKTQPDKSTFISAG